MNIKSIVSNILPIDFRAKVDGHSAVKTHESTDRDADGRRQPKDETEIKHQLTDEEFTEAFELLKTMPGIEDNQLAVKVVKEGSLRWVLILDKESRVVRRLADADLWIATRNMAKSTGKLLDKAL